MENKEVLYEWEAGARYFEKKPSTYFRAIIILGVVLTLLLYFFSQYVLIAVVWVIVFVIYVKEAVPPPKITYQITQFGLQFLNEIHLYRNLTAFTVVKKSAGTLLRLFNTSPRAIELNIVLPKDKNQTDKIVIFLKKKIPYIDKIPLNTIEKFGNTLKRLTGFG